MVKIHLKQGGSVRVDSVEKGEWRIKYHGSVKFIEINRSMDKPGDVTKYFSIPVENVLFIEEIID